MNLFLITLAWIGALVLPLAVAMLNRRTALRGGCRAVGGACGCAGDGLAETTDAVI